LAFAIGTSWIYSCFVVGTWCLSYGRAHKAKCFKHYKNSNELIKFDGNL
jgi:hypothetical protein